MVSLKTRVALIVLSLLFLCCVFTSLALPLTCALAADVGAIGGSGPSVDSLFSFSPISLNDFVGSSSMIYYNLPKCLSFTRDSSDYSALVNLVSDLPSRRLTLVLFDSVWSSYSAILSDSFPNGIIKNTVCTLDLAINTRGVLLFRLLLNELQGSSVLSSSISFLSSRVEGYNSSSSVVFYQMKPVSSFPSTLSDVAIERFGTWCGFPFASYVQAISFVSSSQFITVPSIRLTRIDSLTSSSVPNASLYSDVIFNGGHQYDSVRSQCLSILSNYFSLGFQSTYIGDTLTYTDGYYEGYSTGYNDANQIVSTDSASYTAGFDSGYSGGFAKANQTVSEDSASYSAGYKKANQTVDKTSSSYNAGYNAGVSSSNEYSFSGLIGSVFDVPLQSFSQFFNFEIFGVNLTGLLSSLFVIAVVVTILRLLLG